MNRPGIRVIEAAGHHAEVRIRGRIEIDGHGYFITDPHGRRWNLQWDDTVTPVPPALEVAR